MATVTGYTAARMQEILDATIVDANIVGDDLVLELYDSTTVNVGNVRGPVGPQGPNADYGDIKTSIRTSIPGWLILNGTTHPNADTTYPDLWSVIPASWKSGTSMVLPNMTDTIVEGGGTVGAVTGANTRTLVAANLPPHAHTINHDHGSINSSTAAAHRHTIDHDHPAGNTSSDAALGEAFWSTASGNFSVSGVNGNASVGAQGLHNHTFNVPDYSGNSGLDGDHFHTVNLPSFSGNSGNGPGTSTAVDIQQKALRLNYFIKT